MLCEGLVVTSVDLGERSVKRLLDTRHVPRELRDEVKATGPLTHDLCSRFIPLLNACPWPGGGGGTPAPTENPWAEVPQGLEPPF